jgi:cytochrome P450
MTAIRSISDLPGPPRLPLIGNAHQLRQFNRTHRTMEEWCQRYGPMVRFDIGRKQGVVVGNPEQINPILHDRPDRFRRMRQFETVFNESRFTGVVSQEGDDWRRSRRLVITALNSNHLQRYFHVVSTACERLWLRLQEESAGGRSFDPCLALSAFSLDIIAALAFGKDLNTLGRGDNALQGHIKRHFLMINRRFKIPVPYWRWVRLPLDRAWERSLAELHSAVDGFIEDARRRLNANPQLRETPENFLQSMIVAQEQEDKFTDDEIVGNTLTLLLAGEDTTANTMAWTTWMLARHPEVQARWTEEASDALGDKRFVDTYETVQHLRFGEAVLRESMRLRPVIPFTGLEPLTDVTIDDTHIPAGTLLIALFRYAGLYESGVGRALEFDPQRWLEEDKGSVPDQRSFLAFGAGPRFCPGRNLAFLEAKAGMATIARNFQLEIDESGGPVGEKANFTIIPENLRLRMRPRRRPMVDGA